MDAANFEDVRTDPDMRLPHELAEDYQATFTRLRRLFRARGVLPEETADLAQETIVRTLLHLNRQGELVRTADGVRHPKYDNIEPLLKRIATNLLIDRARSAAPQLLPIDGADEHEASSLDPSDEVARRQQQHQVHDAINDLSTRHRQAMLLSLEGLTPAEIADHLGIGRNAADALLYRARRRLAKQLSSLAGLVRITVVLAGLRIRGIARRASAPFEPVAAGIGQVAFGVAAVATLGAVLAFSFPPSQTPAEAREGAAKQIPVPIVASASPATDAVVAAEPSSDTPARSRAIVTTTVDPAEQRVSTNLKDPTSPDREMFWLDVWEEDDGDPSVVGTTLDAAVVPACQTAPKACQNPQGSQP